MSQPQNKNPFGAKASLATSGGAITYYSLSQLEKSGVASGLSRFPFSVKVILEALLRTCNGVEVSREDVENLARWSARQAVQAELPFKPARVILQDFTGVPVLVDLAAMRSAMKRLGGDPKKINPLVPVDLVIDHSVQVDAFGSKEALEKNVEIEFQRNRERYEFLRWGQNSVERFRVVPPSIGIVHQVNLEFLARGVLRLDGEDGPVAVPDTLVGTDSHTTMINGLGVVGWGVGGIEAEAVMLGQPLAILSPRVVGMKLYGQLKEGVTATDLTLTVTQMLRQKGVVDKFVEFYGPGLSSMSLADRATIANMSPEYGATIGFFPIDAETLEYLRRTGRPARDVELVERYAKEQGLFRTDDTPEPEFTDTLSLDLGSVEPSLAGPKRPQDRVPLREMKSAFRKGLMAPLKERGFALDEAEAKKSVRAEIGGQEVTLGQGALVIAAITSCTNTSNPSVLIAAGLLAKKAREKGLQTPAHVKTSLAPGSRVVTEYLRESGLLPELEKLGFQVVGYGCTTCIAAGTPVLLANGTARSIEEMPSAGGALLFGPSKEGRLGMALQAEKMDQGLRDCVTLVLQDGRTLICTPDHEIFCADGRWVRADQLALGKDRVVIGLEAPLDEPGAEEARYILQAGGLKFTMNTPQERLRTLAFARLLGHLLGDGSISVYGQGRVHVGQAVDREMVLNDIEVITGKRPAATQYDERKWTIVLPMELTDAIIALDGVRVGQRIHQPPTLPTFVLDDRCPVSVAREFLGGVFGADGQAPVLKRQSARPEDAIIGHPMYSQSAKPEHVGQLKEVMRHLLYLLARCGVKTEDARIYEYPVRRAASSYPAGQDGAPRLEVRLMLSDGLSFVERVGFRYCVDKAMRASAAAVYWRTVEKIHQQRLWMSARLEDLHKENPDLSFHQARKMAAAELQQQETIVFPHYSLLEGYDRFSRLPKPTDRKFQPLHCDSCGFPSPVTLFEQLGVRDWFASLLSREETDHAKRYCVEKASLTLPTFSLQVLDRRAAGVHPVFDLSVNDLHAFVAGSLCVHNCIGNSGPLPEEVAKVIDAENLVAAAVLSGNRNFEGRVHPLVRANYLASPPLVVAYALAGTVDIDLATEPLGTGSDGKPVYLKDVWPSQQEIVETMRRSITPEMFEKNYASAFEGTEEWKKISGISGDIYPWSEASTYIQEPPFFDGFGLELTPLTEIKNARALGVFGDSVTTDHISPAGNIAEMSPAGHYLKEHGVKRADFNSYGSRRGNDRVMVRGTFANIRLKNLMVHPKEGNYAVHIPSGEEASFYDVAARYQKEGTPLVVLAGKEYGTGSSRDWAAKGALLQGIKAVIAESFERIHRSNLVGMGVLPLVFQEGQSVESLGLTGRETFDILGISDDIKPRQELRVRFVRPDGSEGSFTAIARLDTPIDVNYYKNGGILQTVLRNLLKS